MASRTQEIQDVGRRPPPSRRRRWLRRAALAVPAVVALYALAGFVGVPLVANHLVRLVDGDINGRVSVGDVSCNPFTFTLLIDDLLGTDMDGDAAFGCRSLSVDLELWRSLTSSGWHFRSIDLDRPFGRLIRVEGGSFNLITLFQSADATAPDQRPAEGSSVPRLVVDSLAVRNARFEMRDDTLPDPIEFALDGISFATTDFDTHPTSSDRRVISLRTESGGRIEWDGTLSLEPFRSSARLVVEGLYMPWFVPYATRFTDARVDDGAISATLEYDLDPYATPSRRTATIHSIEVRDFGLSREGSPLLDVPDAAVVGATVDFDARRMRVDEVRVIGGSMHLDRDQFGDMNLARMIVDRNEQAASADEAMVLAASDQAEGDLAVPVAVRELITAFGYILEDLVGGWDVSLERIRLEDRSVIFDDAFTSLPVRLVLDDVDAEAGPIRSSESFVIPFRGRSRLNGVVNETSGTFDVRRRRLEFSVRTDPLPLAPYAPYLRALASGPIAASSLRGGTFTLDGSILLDIPTIDAAHARWDGTIAVASIDFHDDAEDSSVLLADRLSIEGTLETRGTRRTAARVTWDGALRIAGFRAGPPIFTSLTFGDGLMTLERSDFVGALAIEADPDSGTRRSTWDGRLEVEGASLDGLELVGQLDGALGLFILDGELVEEAPATGPRTMTWAGVTELRQSGVVLVGPLMLSTFLNEFRIDGTARTTLEPGETLATEWTGAVDFGGASLHLLEAATRLDGATGTIEGTARLERTAAGRGTLEWGGALTLEYPEINHGTAPDDWTASADRLRLEARSARLRASDRVAVLDLDTRLVVLAPDFAVGAEDGFDLDVTDVDFDGLLSLELAGVDTSLFWDGRIAATEPSVQPRNANAGIVGESVVVVGAASVLTEGGLDRIDWNGELQAEAPTFRAPDVAGAVSAGMRRLQAAGVVAAEGRGEDVDLSWRGRVALDELDVRAGDLGGPTTLGLQSFENDGSLLAELRPDATRLSIDGTTSIERPELEVGERLVDARVEIGGIDLRSLATIDLVEPGLAMTWKGGLETRDLLLEGGSDDRRVVGGVGRTQFEGSIDVLDDGTTPVASATGDLTLLDSHGTMTGATARSIDVPRTTVDGAWYDQRTGVFSVDSVIVDGARAFADIPAPSDTSVPEAPGKRLSEHADALPFDLRLGAFRITDGQLEVREDRGRTPTRVLVDRIEVDVRDVATDGSSTSSIDVDARVLGSGRLQVDGTVEPFGTPIAADLTTVVTRVPLPPLSPLSARFIGWRVDAGRLDSTVPIRVADNRVEGELAFVLEDFELGAKVPDSRAPDLPVDLGIALLRDSNGRVQGRIPFSGDISDPEFGFTELIVQAFFSLIGRVVTVPIQLVASFAGPSEELELDRIDFESGSAVLARSESRKIEAIVRLLNQDRSLAVRLRARPERSADSAVLREDALRATALERLQQSAPHRTEIDDVFYRAIVGTLWSELPEASIALRTGVRPPFAAIEAIMLSRMEIPDAAYDALCMARLDAIEAALRSARVSPSRIERIIDRGPQDPADGPPVPFVAVEFDTVHAGSSARE